jgi:RNA polymerase sigma-70 factor (ECF subfamily)
MINKGMLVAEATRLADGVEAEAADLVARLVALDADAWRCLFDAYFAKMHRFALLRTGDPHAAEDIAAEVFAAAARGIGRYRPTGAPLSAWLYGIARHVTADHLDKRRRSRAEPIEDVDVVVEGWAPALDEHRDLVQGLSRLNREQQEVIILRFYNDCSLAEAANAMGKSVGAVKLLQHRALAALRRQMGVTRRGRSGHGL